MHTAHTNIGERSIGAILVDSAKLTLEQAERILGLQKEENLRFGDAAIKLGLLKPEDIQFALARQYDYPYLINGEGNISDELVAAYQPFSPQVEGLRALRSQLMLRWFTGQEDRKTLVVASPGRGDGRSWLAANLAVVFSQLGERTLVIDADMRNPRQHSLFNLENRTGLSHILSGRSEASAIRRIESFRDLSVLPAGPIPPNPQELLGRSLFANFLKEAGCQFDVVIVDTPAAAGCADAHGVAIQASGALLLARKHTTSLVGFSTLVDDLRGVGVQVVGSVISDF